LIAFRLLSVLLLKALVRLVRMRSVEVLTS